MSDLTEQESADLDRRFAYHGPMNSEVIGAHATVRAECRNLAVLFTRLLPDGREKALALTSLENTMMWANASIARDQVGTLRRYREMTPPFDVEGQ